MKYSNYAHMVCQECHKKKIKCIASTSAESCSRCVKLGIDCVPHISRQGMRNHNQKLPRHSGSHVNRKRARNNYGMISNENSDKDNDSNINHLENVDGSQVIATSDLSRFGPQHYGLNVIIRKWITTAFLRRSFKLLNLATSLAVRSNIPMDQILCGINFPGGNVSPMNYLMPILCAEKSSQNKKVSTFAFVDIPRELRRTFDEEAFHEKWLLCIKFNQCGMKMCASTAFERNLASVSTMSQVYEMNEREWTSLFLPDNARRTFHALAAHQVSLYLTNMCRLPLPSCARVVVVEDSGYNLPEMDSNGIQAPLRRRETPVTLRLNTMIENADETWILAYFDTGVVVPQGVSESPESLCPLLDNDNDDGSGFIDLASFLDEFSSF